MRNKSNAHYSTSSLVDEEKNDLDC
jgi:hypothetical protein